MSETRPILVAIDCGTGRVRNRFLNFGERVVVGRGRGCDWRVEASSVSSRHCALTYDDGGLRVEDLGSRHGTLVDDRAMTGPAGLARGQTLRLGGARLRVLGPVDDVPEWPGVRFLGLLGEGALGRVYAAEVDGERRAFKLMFGDLSEREAARCRREAELHAGLIHPGIVRCYGVREHGGRLAILTEALEGLDLERLGRSGPRGWREVGAWTRAAAEALAYAHSRGVVHRDVKPGNLFLGDDGRLRLLDFGFAKRVRPDGPSFALTSLGSSIGTFAYIAPEALTEGEAADERADLYSLAAGAVELITGEIPFPARSFPELLSARRAGPVLDGLQAPEAFGALLSAALSFEREARPSCADLASALRELGL